MSVSMSACLRPLCERKPSQRKLWPIAMTWLVTALAGVVCASIQPNDGKSTLNEPSSYTKLNQEETFEDYVPGNGLTSNSSNSENTEIYSWETSETSMGLPRSMTSSSWQIFWDLGMSLRDRRAKQKDTPATECELALLRVVEHIKNVSYTVEVQNILYNTGKVFNDVGYYTSCMNTTNLTYYLIRPIREDLSTKFNFGVCVPLNCTQEAINTLIADDVINKKWLKHIANGTSYEPQAFTSVATVVPTGQKFTKGAIAFMVFLSVLLGTTLIRPSIELVKWIKTHPEDSSTKDSQVDSEDEEKSCSSHDGQPNLPQETPAIKATEPDTKQVPIEEISGTKLEISPKQGLIGKFLSNWDIWSSLKYLAAGREDEVNCINAIKVLCSFLIVYSAEYLRRQPVGTNQDDKLSLDRTYQSWGYNLAFMAPFALDILFFLSALTNTLSLHKTLRKRTSAAKQQGSTTSFLGLGFNGAVKFYFQSVLARLLRLAPTLCVVAFAYSQIIPGLVTGPFEYLFATTYAQNCNASTGWAYSFFANLIKDTNYCTGTFTWYVFSMFQLYLILPIFVLLSEMSSFVGTLFAITLTTSSIFGSLAVFGIEDLGLVGPYSTTDQFQQYQDHYQSKPWAVGYCWFIGAIFGIQMAKRRLSELNSPKPELRTAAYLTKAAQEDEFNKRTIASIDSVTKGSALTLTPNNLESLIGESDKVDRQQDPAHDLMPSEVRERRLQSNHNAEIRNAAIESNQAGTDDLSWILTAVIILIAISIPVTSFIAFVQFTRTKNHWNAVIQVGFDVIARLAIMLAFMLLIWRMGFTHSVDHTSKNQPSSKFTLLGAMSRFGLAYYLWAMVYVDWGMSSQMVNQYYDPLLVFCYTMADSVVLSFVATPVTLMLEIPLKRLFSLE